VRAAWKPVYPLHVMATKVVWGTLLRLGVTEPIVHLILGTLIGITLPPFLYYLARRSHLARFAGLSRAPAVIPIESRT
jgi:hypothetical protein